MNWLILSALAIACPPVIEVRQDVVPVGGWIAHELQTPHKFYFAQFADGPPAREAILMHDKAFHSGKDKVLQYRFLPSQEPWLICSYTGTSAVLAQRLPPARLCQLTLDHAHNFETVSAIQCE